MLTPNAPELPTLAVSAADTFKLSFTVEDEKGNAVVPVQSMLRLWDEESGEDTLLPFKVSLAGKGRFELNMRRPPPQLPPTPTKTPLNVSLVLASPPHAPVQLNLLHLQLPLSEPAAEHPEEHLYHLQPEIYHTFRPEEKVPPRIISLLGAGAVGAPWALLLILLASLRPSFSFATSPRLLLFLTTLTAFDGLLITYWIQLTLGQVLLYGSILGGITVITGVSALNARKFAL
ncbi:hypothetical protein DACRYDRAFT_66539 [Dacryopinax primogenitus]|uniref:Ribophorin II C-terminal domain-containing protein n=1 Tax=Dacryopinax primogenitus (strain DJM 731) TaxID=1858805 RepID=M5G983_DACPD|nr:uncharacterized protein DACRYDRAFT_66539 [Dacryopinax primogenitus]EJU02427.1 hypothetical protein DACRYDRAFT_66539 [Dacryopinax primogenitus]